jgi:acetylornithine deacetylase/succinyl-diaminopimelate desuccinylase-like protein
LCCSSSGRSLSSVCAQECCGYFDLRPAPGHALTRLFAEVLQDREDAQQSNKVAELFHLCPWNCTPAPLDRARLPGHSVAFRKTFEIAANRTQIMID